MEIGLAFPGAGDHFARMSEQIDTIGYCRDMVMRDDHLRYQVLLFAPREHQPALWALYAFNQEVAKTRENVSEATLGEIRLQWWRDVLEELRADSVREHPVVSAMAGTLNPVAVFGYLDELIDARAQDMYDEGPADQAALEAYAWSVGGALSEAALAVCSREAKLTPSSAQMARRTGSAWAMLGLVRAIPFHWASNRNFVPGDKGRASLATTDADKMFELAEPAISDMLGYVDEQLAMIGNKATLLPKDQRHVALLNVLTRQYREALKKAGGNPFKLMEPSGIRRLTGLARAAMFGRL